MSSTVARGHGTRHSRGSHARPLHSRLPFVATVLYSPLFRLHKLHAAEWSSGYPPEVLQVAAGELQRAAQHHHALIAYVVAPKLQAPQVWVSEDGCAEVVTGIAVEEATGQPAQGRCVCELYTMKGWELGPPHGIP